MPQTRSSDDDARRKLRFVVPTVMPTSPPLLRCALRPLPTTLGTCDSVESQAILRHICPGVNVVLNPIGFLGVSLLRFRAFGYAVGVLRLILARPAGFSEIPFPWQSLSSMLPLPSCSHSKDDVIPDSAWFKNVFISYGSEIRFVSKASTCGSMATKSNGVVYQPIATSRTWCLCRARGPYSGVFI